MEVFRKALENTLNMLDQKKWTLIMLNSELKKSLISIFGPDGFADSKEDCLTYSYDATSLNYPPDAIVFAETAEQVSALMKLAERHNVPIVPRGAGSGYTGGSLAVEGGIILVMEKMNRILQIDSDDMFAIVEPGVITGQLHAAVEKLELFYPPDPASMEFATIGGNIAENAGGMRAVKYGVTRNYVMGLEVVLPNGEIVQTGSRCIKDVVGYDLTNLFVGSEGTLGTITKAILKLIPLPEAFATAAVSFPTLSSAAKAVPEIMRQKIIPSTLEFMDKHCITAVDRYLKVGLPQATEAFLLIEVDGFSSELRPALDKITAVCKSCGAIDIKVATDAHDRARLWKIRRSITAALTCYTIKGDGEDMVVPRSCIPDIIEEGERIGDRHNLVMINYGHAGDGNIHVCFAEKDIPVSNDQVELATKALLTAAVGMNGRIAAEHGIGCLKRNKVPLNIDPPTLKLMKQMKNMIDPAGILNPGKIFPQETNTSNSGE